MASLQNQDLLTGSVPRRLLAFSMPFLAANVLQSVYAVVDTITTETKPPETARRDCPAFPLAARSPVSLPPRGWD